MKSMIIVGSVYDVKEAKEIEFIAKLVVVGKRARFLAHAKSK